MTISEIHSYASAKDPVIPAVPNVSPSEKVIPGDAESSNVAFVQNILDKSKEVKKIAEEKISRVTELMNNYVQSLQKDIKIQINNDTGDILVKVISEENGKVIREIPSEELLELAARMEEISGVFFDRKI